MTLSKIWMFTRIVIGLVPALISLFFLTFVVIPLALLGHWISQNDISRPGGE